MALIESQDRDGYQGTSTGSFSGTCRMPISFSVFAFEPGDGQLWMLLSNFVQVGDTDGHRGHPKGH